MKITSAEKKLIAVARIKSNFQITADVFEKDFLLSRIIAIMSRMSTEDVTPIFCGGTSLSKAHGIISRMSEDIDFKLVVNGLEGLTGNQRRKRLSEVKKYIQIQLIEESCGLVEPSARDKNQFFRFDIPYESLYRRRAEAIKPYIQLECINIHPAGPVDTMPVYSIVARFIDGIEPATSISCESLQETAAEKTVGMLRRFGTAMRRGKLLPLAELTNDKISYLSRHIYDLAQIFKRGNVDDNDVATFVTLQIENDRMRYSRSSEDFHNNPADIMFETLNELARSEIVREYYEKRLSGIIFDGELPSYRESMGIVEERVGAILRICENGQKSDEREGVDAPRL